MQESKTFSSGSYYSTDHRYARSAPNWSADRAMKQYPEFLYASADGDEPVLFTGEMVKPPRLHRSKAEYPGYR
jgi:hypothetical protein